ncbi:hypothetical protein SAMN04488137_0328, partial [Fictibacillus solisalsi]
MNEYYGKHSNSRMFPQLPGQGSGQQTPGFHGFFPQGQGGQQQMPQFPGLFPGMPGSQQQQGQQGGQSQQGQG